MAPTGESRVEAHKITVPTSHSIFQQRDHSRAELSFRLCILTGYEPRAVKMQSLKDSSARL